MAENDMLDPADAAFEEGVKIFSASYHSKLEIINKIQHLHGEVATRPPCTTF